MSVPSTGYKILVEDRRYEDYKSMKQWFRNHRVKENIFSASQDSSVTTTIDGSDAVIGTLASAAALAYIKTESDDGTQDGKKVWVIYQDTAGAIHGPIEHLLAAAGEAGTEVVHALGNEGTLDTMAAGQGTTSCTLTNYDASVLGPDNLKGQYLVCYSGDDVGIVYEITANSKQDPTVCTVDPATSGSSNADLVQIQTYPCDDFYRVREMYCELAPTDDAQIIIGDPDVSPIYAAIAEGGRYSAHSNFFTQPAATCRSFLGRVKAVAANVLEAAAANSGQIVAVTFTPLEAYEDGESADITMSIEFTNTLDWQPCIELEPATDVIISITDTTTATSIHVEVTCLEVYPS